MRWTLRLWPALLNVAVLPLITGATGEGSCQVCVVEAGVCTRSNTMMMFSCTNSKSRWTFCTAVLPL